MNTSGVFPHAQPARNTITNEQIMAWMMDTYSMNQGSTASGVVTGKPIFLGGSLGRHEATGRGVFVVGCEAASKLGMEIKGVRIAVQGFGNVGGGSARLFTEAGAKVAAMQDHVTTVVREAFSVVLQLEEEKKASLGTAAFIAGCTRVLQAREKRGLYP